MQKDQYKNTWAVSQSSIKDFRYKSPKRWKEIWIDKQIDIARQSDSFTFGSLVDTILFTPEEMDNRFFVSGAQNLPSKIMRNIANDFYYYISMQNTVNEQKNSSGEYPEKFKLLSYDMSDKEEDILLIADDVVTGIDEQGNETKGWNKRWGKEKRITKILAECQDYVHYLSNAKGRKIISLGMNLEAINVVDVLRTDKRVKDYFVERKGQELIYQHEIFIDYTDWHGRKIPLKGALDIVRIDHHNMTVQIADFKTSANAFDFIKSIKQFDYVGQLSFYDFLLRQWLEEYCDGAYCKYNVLEPINIVIDVNDKVPYIYEYDWRDISLAREGNSQMLFDLYQTLDHDSRIKKGWMELLNDITWHYNTGNWQYPKEMYETGKIRVNLLNS